MENSTDVQTSNDAICGLRELSVQCQALLRQLSADNGSTNTKAKKLMASFNIWTAKMGVFREGQQSVIYQLKTAPEISVMIRRLLVSLKRNLENKFLGIHEEEEDYSGSDDSSDRVYSYAQLQATKDENTPLPRQLTVWTSVQNLIISLHQLVMNVRLVGDQRRWGQFHDFKNLDQTKNMYRTLERCARQKVDYLFPKSSDILRGRMAESIATRRVRFLYLEQNHKNNSTLNEPAPELEQNETIDEDEKSAELVVELGKLQVANLGQSSQSSAILSNTTVTERTESVSSANASTGTFPSIPRLDPGGTSFTCPYCSLVYPAKEASGQSQWRSHLIRDFEPFFCVFDNCRSPFTCAVSYTSWASHIRNTHTKPEWYCFYCDTDTYTRFSSPVELESHLTEYHRGKAPDSLRPTILRHSMIRDRRTLQECPFCGEFPEDIEESYPDRDCKQAIEALEKHVGDHLVSVALILALEETGEPEGEVDDMKSEAQRDNVSERDFDEVGDTYELECQNDPCGCKEREKDTAFNLPGNDS